ncbi:NUDIX domain-containing protein [Spongiibacter tropicus]|uniref:NUDIX domain-containing protein n=1 Tax=Spongiibacter tropicus TaxID=454602 RepID=UPI002353C8E3|nr:NUDIX domain-containing protein [Spongiibacter tropicus]|tara:strand:+ start:39310 stop:40023 length:714 start_codon:yes stop_codon:yes gene_type:complete
MPKLQSAAPYNIHDYDVPLTTVDSVLFTVHQDELKVLLVKRGEDPFEGKWGLPGGFINLGIDTSLEDCAIRKLKEKTGIAPPYIEQLCSVGGGNRDPRGWAVTVVFYALVAYEACQSHVESVVDVQWHAVDKLKKSTVAFDHLEIIRTAQDRLKQKALYSIVPAYALPDEFTLSELQSLHEVIIGSPLQRKSFQRRIEIAELLEETGRMSEARGRPAKLYRAKDESRAYRFVRNLEG